MNTLKIINKITIGFCLLGLIYAIVDQNLMNRAFSIVVNTTALYFLIKTLNKPKQNRIVLLIIYAIQIISVKFGMASYLVIIGIGYIHYFNLEDFRHTSSFISLSRAKIALPVDFNSIGINIISLGTFLYLLFYNYKKTFEVPELK